MSNPIIPKLQYAHVNYNKPDKINLSAGVSGQLDQYTEKIRYVGYSLTRNRTHQSLQEHTFRGICHHHNK